VRAGLLILVTLSAITLALAGEPAFAEEGLFEQDALTGDWGGAPLWAA
jgi:hypothetical protein